MLFTENLKQEAQPIIDAIYEDDFVQSMINGTIPKSSVIHYLRADSRYLNEFAKVYALLIPKTNIKEEIQFLIEQIQFSVSGEVDAHHTLAEYVGKPYEEIIKDGEWYPTADHYIKHMYYNAYAYDNAGYTIAAMAPCPYVYQQIGKRALRENQFPNNHPLKKWFEFYATEMDELLAFLSTILNEFAKKSDTHTQSILRKNFLQSMVHERNFFAMAYNKERWEFERD